ncbi:MAG: DNA alkylation repair protein [Bacteroidetes bacterium]|nr:MAG: DNA alkylation repair protein [Bacteroidota bacterium]
MIDELIRQMYNSRNDEKAVAMKAYMKDHFNYFGIQSEKRKEIQKLWFQKIGKDLSPEMKRKLVLSLWDQDQRECQYVALDYINTWSKKEYSREDIELIYHLITTKSWWDTVDGLASNFMGKYFSLFPEEIEPIISNWRNDEDMWVRRSCLLFQLKYGKNTNTELLYSLIDQYLPDKQFFIQKAIGWTLRQYSKFDPQSVRDYLKDKELGSVAKREAYKYL